MYASLGYARRGGTFSHHPIKIEHIQFFPMLFAAAGPDVFRDALINPFLLISDLDGRKMIRRMLHVPGAVLGGVARNRRFLEFQNRILFRIALFKNQQIRPICYIFGLVTHIVFVEGKSNIVIFKIQLGFEAGILRRSGTGT